MTRDGILIISFNQALLVPEYFLNISNQSNHSSNNNENSNRKLSDQNKTQVIEIDDVFGIEIISESN